MKALHFGAGNIGRGFIGYLLHKSGYDVTFVDPVKQLVDNINHYGQYSILTLGDIKKEETVNGIRAISLNDTEKLEKAVIDTNIITTSIGVNNLYETGKTLAPMLRKRSIKNNSAPLDVIACENALFATEILKRSVYEGVSDDFTAYLNTKVGFPNCAVDRIVPNTTIEKKLPVDIMTEPFFEWDIESSKILYNNKINGAHYVERLDPYLERKLFLLNGAHAAIAYLGSLKKYKFVHEAIQDPLILADVKDFHRETSAALQQKYNFEKEKLGKYSDAIINRFKNAYLADELFRVGRDPLRKLGRKDRLVAPLLLCDSYNLPNDAIILAIAAGFKFSGCKDISASKIQDSIVNKGIYKTVENVTGLQDKPVLVKKIAAKYKMLV